MFLKIQFFLAPDEDVDKKVRNTYQHHIDDVE
jgi:hypothetical protein